MAAFREKIEAEFEKKKHSFVSDYDAENNREYQNRIKPRTGDVVADFHMNAAANKSASGVEVFVSNNAGPDSRALAKELVDGLASIMGIPNRGVKTEKQSQHTRIGILNKPGTAVLIEFCFITNPGDLKAFLDNEDKIAAFVAEKIIKYDKNK
jgi:N-acetylmuramoyl-L-alanine amidase